jgi:hypothetical protein
MPGPVPGGGHAILTGAAVMTDDRGGLSRLLVTAGLTAILTAATAISSARALTRRVHSNASDSGVRPAGSGASACRRGSGARR